MSELKNGDIYSVKSTVEFTAADGKKYPYTLIKLLDIDGDIISWRTFDNFFTERPESADSSLNYSGEKIDNFGVMTGFLSSGKEEIGDFKNSLKERDAKFFIHASISDYDIEIIGSNIKRRIYTTDKLLDSSTLNIQAGKTGYLDEAGGCLLVKAENDQGNDIIAVVLGSEDKEARFIEIEEIVKWIFDSYQW